MDLFDLREPVSAWSHGVWLLLIVPGALLLWRRTRGDRARQKILLGYVVCLAVCASASSLYHGVQVPEDELSVYLLFDHIGIYLLIAGSYTPIAWTLMRGRWRLGTLAAAWLAAAAGISLNLYFGDLPGWLGTTLYLAMGWGSIFCYLELARTFSHATLRPIVFGGVLYSVGAMFHLLQWPILWPGLVGGHEVFHVLVVAGSITHFKFMLRVVAPWVHPQDAMPVAAPVRTRQLPFRRSTTSLLSGRLPRGKRVTM
jgi:hemolysin III